MEVSVATDTDTGLSVIRNENSMHVEDGSIAHYFNQSKGCSSSELMPTVELNDDLSYLCKQNSNYLQTIQSKANETNEEKVMLIPIAFSSQQPLHFKEIKSRAVPGFSCDEKNCEKVYTTAQHLKVHKRSHTGEKPFQCKYANCNKMFTTFYALKAHSRVHTGEKPFPCPQADCKKAFKTSSDLQKHIRTHTGEKPFKCPFPGCSKAFTTSDICKVHIRTHTGERPHKCPFPDCEKSFSNYTNYKNHIRTHTGEKPYVCMVKDCGKRFTEYSSLYKHQIVHSVQKPYKCSLCSKSYRQASTLVYHKKRVHNEYSNSTDQPSTKKSKNESIPTSTAIISNPPPKEELSKEDPYDSTLVLLPVESLDSNCFVVNDSSNSQLSLLSSTENQNNKFQLVTSPVNNDTLVVTLPEDSPALFGSQSDVAATNVDSSPRLVVPDDDSLIYINKQALAPSPAVPVLNNVVDLPSADCSVNSSNPSNVWLNCSESTFSPTKQTDVQLSLGTVYVFQVVPDQVGLKAADDCVLLPSSDKKDENKYFTSDSLAKAPTSVHVQSPRLSALAQPASTQSTVTSRTELVTKPVSVNSVSSKCIPKNKAISFPAAKRRITVTLPRKLTSLSKKISSKPEIKKRFLLPKLHDLQQ